MYSVITPSNKFKYALSFPTFVPICITGNIGKKNFFYTVLSAILYLIDIQIYSCLNLKLYLLSVKDLNVGEEVSVLVTVENDRDAVIEINSSKLFTNPVNRCFIK